jgi:hypothetical protein
LLTKVPRRGVYEHRYQATKRALYSSFNWDSLPTSIRGGMNVSVLRTFDDQVIEAIEANTMDAREDSHFSWWSLELDEQGWTHLAGRLKELYEEVEAEQVAAAERMVESGEAPLHATVALAGFESPPPKRGKSLGPRTKT